MTRQRPATATERRAPRRRQADRSADTRAIRALNAKIHGDPRFTMALLPIGDGLMLARKK